MGFQQNMERLSFKETAFSTYIQLVKLIFGEEPLHTLRKIFWWEISHIDVFGKISRSKVKGMKINEQFFNPPIVKPFRLTYLARGGCHHPLEILTIACLTFCLLLTDRPTLGLPEYKLEVVNICKMHRTGGLEVITLSLGNGMTYKTQVRCKVIEATLLCQFFVFCC